MFWWAMAFWVFLVGNGVLGVLGVLGVTGVSGVLGVSEGVMYGIVMAPRRRHGLSCFGHDCLITQQSR